MLNIRRYIYPLLILLCLTQSPTIFALPYRTLPSQTTQISQFIDTMVNEHQFDKAALNKLFNQITPDPTILHKMQHPAEKTKPWYVYRKIFLTPDRVKLGVQFWQQHEKALARAEKEYGVPAEIITAILGVETKYGREQGQFSVLNALTTLAFHYPSRARFFKKELAQFLLLSRELKVDPTSIRGSYAGAIGYCQFMPSSYRYYAIDFNHNGKRELRFDPEDAIGSIANYLHENGWARGEIIAVPAHTQPGNYQSFLRKKAKPIFKLSTLQLQGIQALSPLDKNTSVSLIELQGKEQPQYWLGLQNFYSITRYNTSKLYAMAVMQLGQQIKDTKQKLEQRHDHKSTTKEGKTHHAARTT